MMMSFGRGMMRTAVALQICWFLTSCDRLPFVVNAEETATRACEQQLKGYLTSPSSYKRLWSTFTPAGALTKDEQIEKFEADRVRAAKAGNDADAFASALIVKCLKHPNEGCQGINSELSPRRETAFVLIEYEAANAFNARLPGYFTCRMIVSGDGNHDAGVFTSSTLSKVEGDRLKSLSKNIHGD